MTFVLTAIERRTIASRPMPTRFAARIVTGPVGHFIAGTVDWLALIGRYLKARATGRDPWG